MTRALLGERPCALQFLVGCFNAADQRALRDLRALDGVYLSQPPAIRAYANLIGLDAAATINDLLWRRGWPHRPERSGGRDDRRDERPTARAGRC